MGLTTYEELLATAVADQTAVGNSVAEAIIIPDLTLNANYLYQGRKLRCKLWGVISNVVTAVPTITLKVHIGTATLSATFVAASGALACNATANTNLTWMGDVEIGCRSVGTAGTGFISGQVWLPNLTAGNAVGNVGYPNLIPVSAPAAGTINTTVANLVGIAATWSAANASNTITVNQYTWEALN